MSRHFVFVLLSIWILGCSTDIQLEEDQPADIPIVYAFLEPQAAAQYLRVEKAFLVPGANALDIARDVNELYYGAETEVRLKIPAQNKSFRLERINGADEGFPRQSGPFAETPNILYKLPASDLLLQGGEEVTLEIDRGDDKDLVTAATVVLQPIEFKTNRPNDPVTISYDRNLTFAFGVGPNTSVLDVRAIIHYRENSPGNPTVFEDKQIEWVVDPEFVRTNFNSREVAVNVKGINFYKAIAENISTGQDRVRIFNDFDVEVTAGGKEFVDLLSILRANTGITSANDIPRYTNLSEGVGIFTSRQKSLRTGISLTNVSLDSLRDGTITGDLNFQ